MHDLLFERGPLGDYRAYAAELGLDGEAFDACLAEGRYVAKVEADTREALSLGATATPTFLINGRMAVGALPYSYFQEIVEMELAKSGET
jgi:predicted DsbA family dithiol-disulfide isomerase